MNLSEQVLSIHEMGAYAASNLTPDECDEITKKLKPILDAHSTKWELAGSYRRGKGQAIGDLDYIMQDGNLSGIKKDLASVLTVLDVARAGDKIASFVCEYNGRNIQVEFMAIPKSSFGAALMHATGGAEFNMSLRTHAKQKKFMLSQYGLTDNATGTIVAGDTEESIFNHLGYNYIPPSDRNSSFWAVKDKYKIRSV